MLPVNRRYIPVSRDHRLCSCLHQRQEHSRWVSVLVKQLNCLEGSSTDRYGGRKEGRKVEVYEAAME